MAKIKKGMCWHVHHNFLLEYCHNYDGRVRFTKEHKPAHEVEPRLRWMQMVKGKLPDEVVRVGKAYDKAWKVYDKTREAFDEAWEACDGVEARNKTGKALNKALEARNKALKACDKAWKVYDKTKKAYCKVLKDNKDLIEKLHAEECPDCSWNGENLAFKPWKVNEMGKCEFYNKFSWRDPTLEPDKDGLLFTEYECENASGYFVARCKGNREDCDLPDIQNKILLRNVKFHKYRKRQKKILNKP